MLGAGARAIESRAYKCPHRIRGTVYVRTQNYGSLHQNVVGLHSKRPRLLEVRMVKHYAYCLSMSRGGFPYQAETKCEPHPPPAFGKWRLTNEK